MTEKKPTWYVVADGTRARVLTLTQIAGRDPNTIINTVVSAFDREFVGPNLKSREILADSLGRRTSGHPATPADPHENAKFGFAHELGQVLEQGFNEHRFEHLVLVATPDMLGKLRGVLKSPVRKCIIAEDDKDLTRLSDHELAARLTALTKEGSNDSTIR